MNKKPVKMLEFQERLKTLITDEMKAAIGDADEERAFNVVTAMAWELAQAIRQASLCDEDFVDNARDAIDFILECGDENVAPQKWPLSFVSKEALPQ